MKKLIIRFIATGAYSGYAPIAPGTAGSLLALVLILVIPVLRGPILALTISLFFILGLYTAGEVEKSDGHDAQIIVIDEIVGMWITVLYLPQELSWYWLVGAFIFFRIFDIFKPFPINRSQKLKGGWGVMADDLIAGLMSNISIRILTGILLGRWL